MQICFAGHHHCCNCMNLINDIMYFGLYQIHVTCIHPILNYAYISRTSSNGTQSKLLSYIYAHILHAHNVKQFLRSMNCLILCEENKKGRQN